jgi:hypothetical protein
MRKKEYIPYGRSKKEKPACSCASNKKKAIKLCSNLYEINMRYVQPVPKKHNYYAPAIDFQK